MRPSDTFTLSLHDALPISGPAAPAGESGAAGRGGAVRRTGVAAGGSAAPGQRWARHDPPARRPRAGARCTAGLCDLPALAAGRAVRAAARARRCRAPATDPVLRRGTPAVQGYAPGPARAPGAGGAADPLAWGEIGRAA